jgi:hypothetical protein
MVTLAFRGVNSNRGVTLMLSFFLSDGPSEPFTTPWPHFRPQLFNIGISEILDPEPDQKLTGTDGYLRAF